jgi:cation diffusion facilitator family transporter
MNDTQANQALGQNARREKSFVAASSVAAAVLLTSIKIAVGWTTGSLGILSEAAHSALDLVAAVVTLWAVRASAKPADREHTYGHGKFENLSALFETTLLLVTCVWIVYEAFERLFIRTVHVDPSFWSFAIMATSIVVDYSRSTALARVAKKYDSQALEADALHFSTDIWSSAVVIGGLGLVYLSEKLGLPWLANADSVAALAVAGIVVWVSLRLGKKSIDSLLDAIPAGMHEAAVGAAFVDGVLDVRQVRIRRSGSETFADVTLTVRSETAFERAHQIASEAEAAVRNSLPGADVVVHVEPVEPGSAGILTTIRLVAARHELGAHGIRVYERDGRTSIDLHLEVPETLRLREAHDRVTVFETALHAALPSLDQIETHIEPLGDHSAKRESWDENELLVRQAMEELCAEHGLQFSAHALKVQRVAGELTVSFHCAMNPDVSIADAHALTEQIEKGLRWKLPSLGRVIIHVEPPHHDGNEAGASSP